MKLSKIKNIHFVGIGGVGMVGIAEMLLNQGFTISGSDLVKNKNTSRLEKMGAKIFLGHNKKNVSEADVIVYSSAVVKSNPEIKAAEMLNKTIIPRAEMLASLMRGFHSIAVAGSHGKTSTTSLISNIFIKANLDPTFIIGGKILGQESRSILGASDYIIVEADESDASFLHLNPEISVVTNVDNDHLDFYENDPSKLQKTFHQFLENLPFYGTAVICIDDEGGQKLFDELSRPKISYGFKKSANFYIKNLKQLKNYQEFSVTNNSNGKEVRLKLKIPGKHNALNATAAYIVAKQAGINTRFIKDSLSSFGGVSRRLEEKGSLKINNKSITLIDDYGHHPTEITATVDALTASNRNKKINMIFQPHRFSRSSLLFDDFIKSLSSLDLVILMDIYSAGEQNLKGISAYDFVDALRKKGTKALFAKNLKEISSILESEVKDGDILVTQGAGNVVDISNSLKALYK